MKRTCEVSRDLRLVVDILDTDGWSCSNKICGVYPTQRTLDYGRNKTGLIRKGVRFVDLVSGPLLSELMNPARPPFLLPILCTPTTRNPFTSNKSTDSSSINVICRNWTWEEK